VLMVFRIATCDQNLRCVACCMQMVDAHAPMAAEPPWFLVRKNPTFLTYETTRVERRNCTSAAAHAAAAVCAFDLKGDYLNVGHAAQRLFRCFSFFHSATPHGGHQGRRYLLELSRPSSRWPSLVSKPWPSDLVRAMGAEYTLRMPDGCTQTWRVPASLLSWVNPWPGYSTAWFTHRQVAHELASLVVHQGRSAAELARGSMLRGGSRGGELRVGVLNRLGSKRPWTQSSRFAELMARRRDDGSPNATHNPLVAAKIVADFVFDEWTMDNLTLAQQVASVRSHDIIISPHGAQNINFAFARPCTVLLELFPDGYLLPMYLDAGSEAGALGFLMHPGTDLGVALRLTSHTAGNNNRQIRARSTRVTTPATRVLDALPELVAAHRQCLLRQTPLLSPPGVGGSLVWDGIPTVGGARWLHPVAPMLPKDDERGHAHTDAHTPESRPRCVYCNKSAACCDDGWHVDARDVFKCTACY